MIAAGNPQTAEIGAHILAAGGNAVDAAVSAAFASCLTEIGFVPPFFRWLPISSTFDCLWRMRLNVPVSTIRMASCNAREVRILPRPGKCKGAGTR